MAFVNDSNGPTQNDLETLRMMPPKEKAQILYDYLYQMPGVKRPTMEMVSRKMYGDAEQNHTQAIRQR